MRRIGAILAAALGLLLLVLVSNTLRFTSRQVAVEPLPEGVPDRDAAARLAGALRFRTVSPQDPAKLDAAEFRGLARYLERTFPRVHRTLARETIAEQSVLFTWAGRERELPPLLLLAHLDVVPVDPVTESAWTH